MQDECICNAIHGVPDVISCSANAEVDGFYEMICDEFQHALILSHFCTFVAATSSYSCKKLRCSVDILVWMEPIQRSAHFGEVIVDIVHASASRLEQYSEDDTTMTLLKAAPQETLFALLEHKVGGIPFQQTVTQKNRRALQWLVQFPPFLSVWLQLLQNTTPHHVYTAVEGVQWLFSSKWKRKEPSPPLLPFVSPLSAVANTSVPQRCSLLAMATALSIVRNEYSPEVDGLLRILALWHASHPLCAQALLSVAETSKMLWLDVKDVVYPGLQQRADWMEEMQHTHCVERYALIVGRTTSAWVPPMGVKEVLCTCLRAMPSSLALQVVLHVLSLVQDRDVWGAALWSFLSTKKEKHVLEWMSQQVWEPWMIDYIGLCSQRSGASQAQAIELAKHFGLIDIVLCVVREHPEHLAVLYTIDPVLYMHAIVEDQNLLVQILQHSLWEDDAKVQAWLAALYEPSAIPATPGQVFRPTLREEFAPIADVMNGWMSTWTDWLPHVLALMKMVWHQPGCIHTVECWKCVAQRMPLSCIEPVVEHTITFMRTPSFVSSVVYAHDVLLERLAPLLVLCSLRLDCISSPTLVQVLLEQMNNTEFDDISRVAAECMGKLKGTFSLLMKNVRNAAQAPEIRRFKVFLYALSMSLRAHPRLAQQTTPLIPCLLHALSWKGEEKAHRGCVEVLGLISAMQEEHELLLPLLEILWEEEESDGWQIVQQSKEEFGTRMIPLPNLSDAMICGAEAAHALHVLSTWMNVAFAKTATMAVHHKQKEVRSRMLRVLFLGMLHLGKDASPWAKDALDTSLQCLSGPAEVMFAALTLLGALLSLPDITYIEPASLLQIQIQLKKCSESEHEQVQSLASQLLKICLPME